MRFLLNSNGSYGDVYPFIAIARELQRRGHDVHLVASGYFEQAADLAGIPFTGLGTPKEYERLVRSADLTHPTKGLRVVGEAVIRFLPDVYDTLDRLATPDTVLIGSTLAFATNILHETRGLRWIPVHLAPSIFRSNIDPPRVNELGIPRWLPNSMKNAMWWLGDRVVIDPLWGKGVNEFRQTLGLSSVSRLFRGWLHSPHLTIGLFPDWFAQPQNDWPDTIRLTNFPLYDQGEEEIDEEVKAFLDAGDPPVVFVSGTATAKESRYYAESVKGCVRAGLRGIVLTRFPDQLPELPDSVRHFSSIPFSRLLPRCAAIVHHGGIGTSSQALKAGIPQIIRPYGFDQFDNAERLKRLGVASEISSHSYRSNRLAECLKAILNNAGVKDACLSASARLSDIDPLAETCDLIVSAHN